MLTKFMRVWVCSHKKDNCNCAVHICECINHIHEADGSESSWGELQGGKVGFQPPPVGGKELEARSSTSWEKEARSQHQLVEA